MKLLFGGEKMWVSRRDYEHFLDKQCALDSLFAKAREMSFKGEPGIAVTGRCYLILNDVYQDLLKRLESAEDSVRILTAERDWYKNAYAEQQKGA